MSAPSQALGAAPACRVQAGVPPIQTGLDAEAYWKSACSPARVALREKGRGPSAYCLRDPVSGLALRWGNDLQALLAEELADGWDQLMRMAAAWRAIAVGSEARTQPPKIGIRMAPTAGWGLPTPPAQAYAPGLALIAGNRELVWTVVDGATEAATREALAACLRRQARASEGGTG